MRCNVPKQYNKYTERSQWSTPKYSISFQPCYFLTSEEDFTNDV